MASSRATVHEQTTAFSLKANLGGHIPTLIEMHSEIASATALVAMGIRNGQKLNREWPVKRAITKAK
jgi:hypothetical protein